MKRLKLFPKTFLYTLGMMIFITVIAHLLLYLFAPQMVMSTSFPTSDGAIVGAEMDTASFVTGAIKKALPVSLLCSFVISIICSLLFSKAITVPVKHISATTQRMAKMDKGAACNIHTTDEIGALAENVNRLYGELLGTIESLEAEKEKVSQAEKSKADFLRTASHELKTPVTALNAILENMLLGVGKYKDYETYLPQCKELTQQLSVMIRDILETSKLGLGINDEAAQQFDVAVSLASICEPFQLIAKTKGVTFSLNTANTFSVTLPQLSLGKALSNILSNAVSYTKSGGAVSVYLSEHRVIIENECKPFETDKIPHLFEPFYRPDFARNQSDGGNGLGLYIVDTLLKSMRLKYDFSAMQKPQGMRFTINL